MPRGVYDRTEVKKIQSQKAKKRWLERGEELRESLRNRDFSNYGRKRTFERFDRNCLICEQPFEIATKKASENKKFCSRKCYFEHQKTFCSTNEYREKMSNQAKTIDRSYMKTEAYSASKRNPETPEYARYRNKVHRLSERTYVDCINVINPERHPRTLCGVEGGWQLDHIKPVRQCFDEGLTAEEASSFSNLRMLPWRVNLMRNYVDIF